MCCPEVGRIYLEETSRLNRKTMKSEPKSISDGDMNQPLSVIRTEIASAVVDVEAWVSIPMFGALAQSERLTLRAYYLSESRNLGTDCPTS
jgi:hypothetical protein